MSAEDTSQKKTGDYEDLTEISDRIEKVLKTDQSSRVLFARNWFRNVLFFNGAQRIIYAKGRWRQQNLPSWYPLSITNKFAEKWNDLTSLYVSGKEIPITFTPTSDDPLDEGMAQVAQRVKEVISAEAETDDKEKIIAGWVIGTGNCFGIVEYDMDEKYGKTFVQYQQCTNCQIVLRPEDLSDAGGCPDCEEDEQEHSLTPAMDDQGAAMGGEYPIGAVQLRPCSPFEIRLDHRITDYKNLHRFVEQCRYDVDYAKECWPDFKDQITADASQDTDQYYLDVLAHVTSNFNVGPGVLGDDTARKTPRCTVYKFYELPSEEYPEGIQAVRIGKNANAVVEAGPLKTQYGAGVKKGQYFLPLIHWIGDKVPGRLYGKTRMDDLCSLQVFRNSVEANIRLTISRMGNGVWLNPKGSGVEIITGEPGQVVAYNPVTLGGTTIAKPERIPAELNNLGPLIDLLARIDDWMERVAGTYFLQGGQAPPGVTAASALAFLGEKSQQAMSSLMAAWAEAWRDFYEKALEVARANWDDARLRVIAGKDKKWQTQKFTKADLQGSVSMLIDYNGIMPRSRATEQATIAQLTQMGMVNPTDPEMQIAVLKKFGALDLKGSVDIDIVCAAKIQEAFMSDQEYMPAVRPLVDNSTILFHEHVNFAKTDEFMELPQPRQQVWYEYIKALVVDIAARRLALTQAGLDPDVPALSEVPSGEAQIAAQAAAQAQAQQQPPNPTVPGQPGGQPGGPPMPGAITPQPSPDIAASLASNVPSIIKPPGSPRAIHVPQ